MARVKTKSKKTLDFINFEDYQKIIRSSKKITLEFSLRELYEIFRALMDRKIYTEKEFKMFTDKKKEKAMRERQKIAGDLMNFLSKNFF